jgi:hypothetical protein
MNTIAATFEGSSDSVTVNRIAVFDVTGRVSLQSTGEALVSPEVMVTLTRQGGASGVPTILDESGNYIFGGLVAGSYTLSPALAPLVSSCLSFSSSSRTVDLTTVDISGQDFAADQPMACHSIRGRVTASTNPAFGVNGIDVSIADSIGGSLRKVTDASGSFDFRYLPPGSYTITPRSCPLTTCMPFVPETRSVVITNSDVIGQDFVEQF